MTIAKPSAPEALLDVFIRRARRDAGLDQSQLAALVGVSRTTVTAWEVGRSEPNASALVRISRATGKPLDWFAQAVGDAESPAVAGGAGTARPEGFEPPTF